MVECEVTLQRLEGDTPDEKAADYVKKVNSAYAHEEMRYSKNFEEVLSWMLQDYFTVNIDGVMFLGLLHGIGRHSTKKEFLPDEDDE